MECGQQLIVRLSAQHSLAADRPDRCADGPPRYMENPSSAAAGPEWTGTGHRDAGMAQSPIGIEGREAIFM